MVVMGVDDVEAWHVRGNELVNSGEFGNIRVIPPESVDGAQVLHIVDPSGVLLIFVQSAAEARSDC